MSYQESIKIFQGKNIRTVWDDEQEEWYFSVVDVCGALTDQVDYDHAKNYWKVLKFRLTREEPESVTKCNQLRLVSPKDGKRYKTDIASPKNLFHIIKSMSSPKEEQFKKWVEQISNPANNNAVQLPDLEDIHGEILLYHPNETIRLEVLMEDETVWLTQAQIVDLFQSSKGNISEHINNIYEQGELEEKATVRDFRTVQKEGERMVTRTLTYYNLDVIISVGFRVNAKRGIKFRQWANNIIKNYLLRGYAINQRLFQMEQRIDARFDAHTQMEQERLLQIETTLADHQEKIDFFVRTNQPPVEGVFYEGQIFDAYRFVESLIKSAKREIILIDNYVDANIFGLLEKRGQGVDATIYTEHVGQSLTHLQQLNQQQYGRRIELREYNSRFHDRFLILDDALYHFGASFKDLGKRLFAFERMGLDKSVILNMTSEMTSETTKEMTKVAYINNRKEKRLFSCIQRMAKTLLLMLAFHASGINEAWADRIYTYIVINRSGRVATWKMESQASGAAPHIPDAIKSPLVENFHYYDETTITGLTGYNSSDGIQGWIWSDKSKWQNKDVTNTLPYGLYVIPGNSTSEMSTLPDADNVKIFVTYDEDYNTYIADRGEVPIDVNGGMEYNIAVYDKYLYKTGTSVNFNSPEAAKLSTDEYIWYLAGNDPYDMKLVNKAMGTNYRLVANNAGRQSDPDPQASAFSFKQDSEIDFTQHDGTSLNQYISYILMAGQDGKFELMTTHLKGMTADDYAYPYLATNDVGDQLMVRGAWNSGNGNWIHGKDKVQVTLVARVTQEYTFHIINLSGQQAISSKAEVAEFAIPSYLRSPLVSAYHLYTADNLTDPSNGDYSLKTGATELTALPDPTAYPDIYVFYDVALTPAVDISGNTIYNMQFNSGGNLGYAYASSTTVSNTGSSYTASDLQTLPYVWKLEGTKVSESFDPYDIKVRNLTDMTKFVGGTYGNAVTLTTTSDASDVISFALLNGNTTNGDYVLMGCTGTPDTSNGTEVFTFLGKDGGAGNNIKLLRNASWQFADQRNQITLTPQTITYTYHVINLGDGGEGTTNRKEAISARLVYDGSQALEVPAAISSPLVTAYQFYTGATKTSGVYSDFTGQIINGYYPTTADIYVTYTYNPVNGLMDLSGETKYNFYFQECILYSNRSDQSRPDVYDITNSIGGNGTYVSSLSDASNVWWFSGNDPYNMVMHNEKKGSGFFLWHDGNAPFVDQWSSFATATAANKLSSFILVGTEGSYALMAANDINGEYGRYADGATDRYYYFGKAKSDNPGSDKYYPAYVRKAPDAVSLREKFRWVEVTFPSFTFCMVDNSGRVAIKASKACNPAVVLSKDHLPASIYSQYLNDETLTFYATQEDAAGNINPITTAESDADYSIFVRYTTAHLDEKPVKLNGEKNYEVKIDDDYIYVDDNGGLVTSDVLSSKDSRNLWEFTGGDPYAVELRNVKSQLFFAYSGSSSPATSIGTSPCRFVFMSDTRLMVPTGEEPVTGNELTMTLNSVQQWDAPTIAYANGTMTITAADGAVIKYTTTDEYPATDYPSEGITSGLTETSTVKAIATGGDNYDSDVTTYVCLPFSDTTPEDQGQTEATAAYLSATQDLQPDGGIEAWIVTGITTSDITITKIETADGANYIPQNQPVLLLGTTASSGFTLKPYSGTQVTIADGTNLLKHSDGTRSVDLAEVYIYSKGEFVLSMPSKTGETLSSGKFYVENPGYSSAAPSRTTLRIVKQQPADTEGIHDNPALNRQDAVWYALDGRRLNGHPTAKGLYLCNGRKVVMK